ncbi:ABC transporter permease [Halovivax limisalsi]|uniref:ABC transporter permease n=1 Tax=Halovivax limisalsi TaxID=1453760 RepID=UPI001FFD92F2|nr:ABC transporter permease subunit [Halovivax limisalsi]
MTDGRKHGGPDDAVPGPNEAVTDPERDEPRSRPGDGSAATRTDGGYGTLATSGVGEAAGSGDWYRQTFVVCRTEYRLAIRSRWPIGLIGVFAAFALGLTTFSGASVGPAGFGRTVASLAVLAVYLVPLVALAFSYDAVVGREESGWLQTLFALPVERAWIVVGTALGRAVVLASATIVGFGIAGGFLVLEYGIDGADTYVGFLLATVGLGLAFLAIGALVSTIASEKTHALGGSLLVWAWFVLVHDLLGLGLIAAFDLSEAAVSAMVLSNPTGVFRALVLGSLGAGGDAGFASVLAEAGLSPGVLATTLLAWIAVPVGLAAVAIGRRRL